jgi:UrcA family protein
MSFNTKTSSTIFTALSAAVISLTCTGLVALAFVPKQTVKFQDLNIASNDGAAALYQRVHVAAQNVCFTGWDKSQVRVERAEACAGEAEARAVSQLNVPELTAYYYQMQTDRDSLTASLK